MSKKTSIEWLINELKKSKHYQQMINEVHQNSTIAIDVIEQSKQMHKEEISESFEVGYENGACVYDGESIYHGSNYYNKTYGGKNEN
jgi:hypothetical protein